MPLDPSIILQAQSPQIANPLDSANKALTMRQLAISNQQQQRAMDDDQATRDAYRNNISPDATGAPVINRPGLLSDLAKVNPMLAMKKNQELQTQDLEQGKAQVEQLKARHDLAADIIGSVPTDPNTPPEAKQAAWTAARQKALASGLPGSDQSPEQYPGDTAVRVMQMHTMNVKDQFEQQNKDRDFDQKRQDLDIKRGEQSNNKQSQALQQTQSILESARGNPAVAQAQKDIYSAQKAETLYKQVSGNPNPEMAKLYISEIAKIAQGGSPTVDELKGLTPGVLTGPLAKAWENLTGDPTPAGMQNFMKQYRDYANSVAGDAKNLVKEKFGRVIETRKNQLGDSNYNALKAQYLDPLADAAKSSFHEMSDGDLDKAYKAAGGK